MGKKFNHRPRTSALRSSAKGKKQQKKWSKGSTADPTKGVMGLLFTFNDCHTVPAIREMINWTNETLDILYPKTQAEETAEADAIVNNKLLIDEYHVKLADYKIQKDKLKHVDTAAETNTGGDSVNALFEAHSESDSDSDSDSDDEGGMQLFGANMKAKLKHDSNDVQVNKKSKTEEADDAEVVSLETSDETIANTTESGQQQREAADQAKTKRVKSSLRPPQYPKLASVTRAQELDLGLRGIGFIHITQTDVDMTKVIKHMLDYQLKQQGIVKTRYVIRLLPIMTSCFSSLESLEKHTSECFVELMKDIPAQTTYCTVLDRRTKHDSMARDEVIRTVCKSIPFDKVLKTDYRSPKMSIVVQIIGRATFIGLAFDYNELSKYNVSLLAEAAMLRNKALEKKLLEDQSQVTQEGETGDASNITNTEEQE